MEVALHCGEDARKQREWSDTSNHIGHDYMAHTYTGHNYSGHNYTGHN